jgi:hypothetical protein
MGAGRATATPADIARALQLLAAATLLTGILLAAALAATLI